MDDAVGCVGRTQRIFVSLPLPTPLPTPVALMFFQSSLFVCVCVFIHLEQNASCKCGKQERRHGHFTQINTCTHPTNQACGRQTDRQTPALTNTRSVYVESNKDSPSCPSVLPPSPHTNNHKTLIFFFHRVLNLW